MQTYPAVPSSANHPLAGTPEVSAYKGYIIVDRVTSADLVDPITNQWLSCPSARSARWTAAVLGRVNRELASSTNYTHQTNDFALLFKMGQVLDAAVEQRNSASQEVH